MKFKKSASAVLIALVAATSVGFSILPSAAVANTHSESEADLRTRLQADIDYLRGFNREYRQAVQAIAEMYRGWSDMSTIVASLTNLELLVDQAQLLMYSRPEGYINLVSQKLHEWEKQYNKIENNLTRRIDEGDARYVAQLVSKDIPEYDKWLKELAVAGYQIDRFVLEWTGQHTNAGLGIRGRIIDLHKNPPQQPGELHSILSQLMDVWYKWSVRLTEAITAEDKSAHREYKQSIIDWAKFAQSYFDAEWADIHAAAKDGLLGAKGHEDYLQSRKHLLTAAQAAINAGRYEEAEKNLNELDRTLFKKWSEEARQTRRYFIEQERVFTNDLANINARIQLLRKKGVDTSEVEVHYRDTKKGFDDTVAMAREYRSTYAEFFDKSDPLNEYAGYAALTWYAELRKWVIGLEETLKQLEATGNSEVQLDTSDANSTETSSQ